MQIEFPTQTKSGNATAMKRNDFADNTRLGEVYILLIVAAIPGILFQIQGFIVAGLDKPGARISLLVKVSLITFEVLGIVAMAVVFLWRFGVGSSRLTELTMEKPAVWRKCFLTLSMACLLLFDVITNVIAAFGGGKILLWIAVPAFAGYLMCNRIAFGGLFRERANESLHVSHK